MSKLTRADFRRFLNSQLYQVNCVREDGTQILISKDTLLSYVDDMEQRLIALASHVADGTSPKKENTPS